MKRGGMTYRVRTLKGCWVASQSWCVCATSPCSPNHSPLRSSCSSRSAGVAFVPPANQEFQRSIPPLFRPIGVESHRAISCLHTPAAGAWHALGMAPSGNGARLKREPRFRQKAFHLHFLHFFLASNSEIASERARAPRLAPLPGVARCRRRWYISKLLCRGDSNKTIPVVVEG